MKRLKPFTMLLATTLLASVECQSGFAQGRGPAVAGNNQPLAESEVPPEPAKGAQLEAKYTITNAPLEPGDLPFPIDLATAMRLADARPLVVTAAQASAWVAEAKLDRAKVLWVPTVNVGADYIRHDGFGPDLNRGVNTAARPINQNINFLYAGGGITQFVAATDAIFEPLAARQVLNARRWDIQSGKNDALYQTARAYFTVHQRRGQYAAAMDVIKRGNGLVERISKLSEDLVPKVEVNRAKRLLADVEQQAALARQEWRISSAGLTRVLRLDPRVVVVPREPDHLQISLIDPSRGLDDLIPIGLVNRPELSSQKALVDAVAVRIRREKGRILLPSVMLNGFQTPEELLQFGAQGIGSGNRIDHWGFRDDFSPQALWQWEGMGLGNRARIKEQRGDQSQQIVEFFKKQDKVAAEVTRAQARLQAASVRVIQAERGVREAIITYDGNYDGLAQTTRFGNVLIQVYRPQEAVIALADLLLSYNEYFQTVAEYNRAEFELFHAMGYPAMEVVAMYPVGESTPVDTNRPGYLPPVQEGPPAATR
jgi:outer membrane protein TolC